MIRFALIGDGKIAQQHKRIIDQIGHLSNIYDPITYPDSSLNDDFFRNIDWVVICSPSFLHYEQIKKCLNYDVQILCEKPLSLPWQPIIDDDRINVVLQYRWADLPDKINEIEVCMIRDEQYLQSWRGDPTKSGGLFYNLFIHYIDLAIRHHSTFRGLITQSGTNIRRADDMNLFSLDMNKLYYDMYQDTLNRCGVKPSDLFYMIWVLNQHHEIFRFDQLNYPVEIRNL